MENEDKVRLAWRGFEFAFEGGNQEAKDRIGELDCLRERKKTIPIEDAQKAIRKVANAFDSCYGYAEEMYSGTASERPGNKAEFVAKVMDLLPKSVSLATAMEIEEALDRITF